VAAAREELRSTRPDARTHLAEVPQNTAPGELIRLTPLLNPRVVEALVLAYRSGEKRGPEPA
jgi:hypothetical protein